MKELLQQFHEYLFAKIFSMCFNSLRSQDIGQFKLCQVDFHPQITGQHSMIFQAISSCPGANWYHWTSTFLTGLGSEAKSIFCQMLFYFHGRPISFRRPVCPNFFDDKKDLQHFSDLINPTQHGFSSITHHPEFSLSSL